MRVWLAWGMVLLCLCAKAQVSLQIDLSYFGANPAQNRQVSQQQTTPFLGNLNYTNSDSVTGMCVFASVPVGVNNIVIQSPPGQKISFQVNILATDSGTVDATNRLSNSGPTYPAGMTSWAIATSDTRYALNTNQAGAYVGIGQLLSTSNSLQSQITASSGVPLLAGTNVIIYQSGGSNVINSAVSQLSVTLAQSNSMTSATNFTIGTSNVLQGNLVSSNVANLTITTNLNTSLSNNIAAYVAGVSNNTASVQTYATGVSNNVVNNFAYSLSLSNFSMSISNSVIATNLASIASTNFQNLVTTTGLVATASNNIQSNMAISNTANLTITTNLVINATNGLSSALAASIFSTSNTVAANAQSALSSTNTLTLAYILTNNPTFSGISTSNFNNLQTTTNLIVAFSNNITPYALGISNNVLNEHNYAVVISNSVVTSSNTVAANAQSALTATNSSLSAALVATNAQIIPVINIASNANSLYTFGVSNNVASVLSHSVTVSNAVVSGTNIITVWAIANISSTNSATIALITSGTNASQAALVAGTNASQSALVSGTNAALKGAVVLITAGTNASQAALIGGTNAAVGFAAALPVNANSITNTTTKSTTLNGSLTVNAGVRLPNLSTTQPVATDSTGALATPNNMTLPGTMTASSFVGSGAGLTGMTNLSWGTSLIYNSNAHSLSLYAYVSNNVIQYYLPTTNYP